MSTDNEFIIFDQVKNLLNKVKDRKILHLQHNILNTHHDRNDYEISKPPRSMNLNVSSEVEDTQNNELLSKKTKIQNNILTKSDFLNQQEDIEISKLYENKIPTTCHCAYYKKKLKSFMKTAEEFKKKYNKEKKITEMLSHKIVYQSIINSLPISNTNYLSSSPHLSNLFNLPLVTQSDKLNSTNITKGDDESKISKLLEKLQDNMNLFEKLENEIINKNLLIRNLKETISHQKQTIESLLDQFNIFSSQANYLVNDLLILKQNIQEKNLTKLSQEFDGLNISINQYNCKIKEFSEQNKTVFQDQVKKQFSTITDIISPDKEKFEDKLLDNRQEDSEITLTLTKSNIKNSFNFDKSMNLLDLSRDELN
jgi:hypothetical protein